MKKLPVIGTTAPTTAFCAQALVLPGGDGTSFLYVDGNQKITAGNGSYDKPVPNAFSLEAQAVAGEGNHCPGSTPTCRKGCYVHGLEKHASATYELYRHNSQEIRKILEDENLANRWVMFLAQYINENCKGGFRWHVSGDVFSPEYARFIADVCLESHMVDHWIYTRSLDDEILAPLAAVSTANGGNLALNLSCDKDNYPQAVVAAHRFGDIENEKRLRLCYLVDDTDTDVPFLPSGSVIFPDYSLRPKAQENPQDSSFWQSLTVDERAMLCPVDAYGKSDKTRCGPCSRCLS